MGNQEAVAGLEQSPEDSKPGGGKFEGQRLSGAFIPDVTERPPYAPGGYDPLPEHVPVIAAIFSAIAPGAGQVYNGEDTRGVQFGLRFMALRPWIASVRQARAQGERIRTYYAPRPIKGAFWRALRYVVLFWGVVIGVCICLVWLGQGIWATVQIKRHEAYQVEVSEVVSRGAVVVQNARVEAVTAVLKGLEEHDTRTDFVMSEEERGQRLFIIGYEYCRRGEHRLCSEIMGRVIALQGGSRSAFRLQTWASVQAQNPREREPLPDVGEVPTLADFEFELEREVLGLPPAKNRAVEDEETP